MNSASAWIQAPPPLAARGFTRRPEIQAARGAVMASFPLQSPAARHLQNKQQHNRQSILILFFVFSKSALFFSSFLTDLLPLLFFSASGGRSVVDKAASRGAAALL